MKRKSSCLGALVVGCLVVVVLSAIVGNLPGGAPAAPAASNESNSAPAAATSGPTATPKPTAAPRGYVSRAEYGDKWPLTVESGVLRCQPRKAGDTLLRDVVIDVGGTTYAINGTSRAGVKAGLYRDVEEIQNLELDVYGLLKFPITPLLEAGLKLCPGG